MADNEDAERRMKAKLNKAKKAKKKRSKAKKAAEEEAKGGAAAKRVQTEEVEMKTKESNNRNEDEEGLEFEDQFEDEFEEEELVRDKDDEEEEDDEDEEAHVPASYYAPSKQGEEELDYDPTAYVALHRMTFEWPALSFDFFRDHMGSDRTRFPTSIWMAAGSQTESGRDNGINLLRISSINRTKEEEEEDVVIMEDGADDGDGAEATLESRRVNHADGNVNRIRAMPQRPGLVATWSESGKVHLYDVSKALSTLHLEGIAPSGSGTQRNTPVFTFSKHKCEGYALDWSPVRAGRLASGDCDKAIHVWDVEHGGSSVSVDPAAYLEHQGSVEDLQWSPTEESVFASCSTDGAVKIWDVRAKNRSMLTQNAHEVDVNVISWNRKVAYLLASGSDDCSFKVWDLRQLSATKQADPVGMFKGFHTDAITSIEWSPHEESVICCASADHQVTVWDLALEEDREFARQASDQGLAEDVLDENGRPIQFPPQLLFVHAGLRDPKEVHFHPQVTGLIGVTAAEGFDLFLCEPLDPRAQQPGKE